ncbi:MAG: Crp/Fnr family transcriptional regulator [Clostridiales bacterium]|nr:Crp/Fnr family transcriptional regulator [Clostridiales bacterium]
MQYCKEVFSECSLFNGINNPVELMLPIQATRRVYHDGEIVISLGYPVEYFGIVLRGEIIGVTYDEEGEMSVLARHGKGNVVGEILACTQGAKSPVEVVARGESELYLIKYDSLFSPDLSRNPEYTVFLKNLMKTISRQYFDLQKRSSYLRMVSLRRKIITYLKDYPHTQGEWFEIKFSREELAGYLGVNRSALSRELSRMKDEALIDYSGRRFRIMGE